MIGAVEDEAIDLAAIFDQSGHCQDEAEDQCANGTEKQCSSNQGSGRGGNGGVFDVDVKC